MCLKMQLHPQTSSPSRAKEITALNSSAAQILREYFLSSHVFQRFGNSLPEGPMWVWLAFFGAILLDPVLHRASADALVNI